MKALSILYNILVIISIKSGTLASNFREALWTLFSQKSKTYIKFPNIINTPRVYIYTSYTELRYTIKVEYKMKLKSHPIVPTNYYTSST